jgi:RNA polymerase sigma-70 factor (ECF subfamily)
MDVELVIKAQHGDRDAFSILAAQIADRFLQVSHRILSDIDLAEDATQQALLSVWQDLPQLRDPARFEAWSYRSSCAPATPRGARPAAGRRI